MGALAGVASQQGKMGLAKNRYERALKEAKKHRCDDNLGRIALNYSNWLYYEGEAKTGLKLLKRYQEKFDHFADSHIFYFAMGLCYEELQELPEAIAVFKEALQRALRFGDELHVARCASHIAEIGMYLKTPVNELREEIEPLLRQIKNPIELMTLLECLLRVEIDASDEKRAQKVYNQGKRLSQKYDLTLGLVDLNLVIAEADWKSGENDRKLQAMRIWADAFGQTLAHDVENGFDESEHESDLDFEDESMAGDVFGSITALITLPPHNSNAEEFDGLLNELEQQLQREFGNSKKTNNAIQLMLKPFDMAKRLIPFTHKPRKQLRELDKFLDEL